MGVHAREEEALARANHYFVRPDQRAAGSRSGYSTGAIYLFDLLVLPFEIGWTANPLVQRRFLSETALRIQEP